MHNFSVATNLNNQQRGTNNRVLEQVVSNSIYRYWIPACSLLQIGASATFVAPTDTIPAHWLIPDTTDDSFSFYMGRPKEWRSGFTYARIHWSSTRADNDAVMNLSITPNKIGEVFAAPVPDTFLAEASDVANALQQSELISKDLAAETTINLSHGGMTLVIEFESSHVDDSNNGHKSLYGLELVYREVARPAGIGN